jgi:uncharacterized protein
MKFIKILSLFLLFSSLINLYPQSLQPIPELNRPIIDQVGILSKEEIDVLEKKILNFEKTKGSQIAVLIVDSTKPESIEEYSIRVVEKWKLGRKNIDDGVLFLIAYNDRKMRLEIGYGLEGVIPDAKAKQILDDYVKPYFKKGEFYKGIYTCIDILIKLIQKEPLPEPKQDKDLIDFGGDIIGKIIAYFFAFIFHLFPIYHSFTKSKLRGIIISILDVILVILSNNFLETSFFGGVILGGFFLLIIYGIFIAIKGEVDLSEETSGTRQSWSRSSDGWSSSSSWSSSDWSSSSSWSSSGWSGGGGSFGGGGASSSW